MTKPAILLGTAEREPIPISQPTLPPFDAFARECETIFATAQITNDRWVRTLEERTAEMLQVSDVVAVSSATAGLMLVAKLLGISGKVLLPSFTFPATLHALLWNRLEPILIDCHPESFNVDPEAVEARCDRTIGGLVPVYIFGNAPDWERLEPLIDRHQLVCFSDAAHALGTRLVDRFAGDFGDAEVFSLAPTKVTVSGEGGLVATRNRELARELRIARNYGNPGDYDCLFAGLNARQSEIHALLGVQSLAQLEASITKRSSAVARYREGLASLPGLRFQRMAPQCRSTHNYFAVLIDRDRFGLTNREVQTALQAEAIASKIYFHPPLHRQSRFNHLPGLRGSFPNTDRLIEEILCLPLFSHITEDQIDRVIEALRSCQRHAEEVRTAVANRETVR